MTVIDPLFMTRLRQILPDEDRLLDQSAALLAFQSDGLTAFAVQPRAVRFRQHLKM